MIKTFAKVIIKHLSKLTLGNLLVFYGRLSRIKAFYKCNQVIKAKFRQSKFLIPVTSVPTGDMEVITPCQCPQICCVLVQYTTQQNKQCKRNIHAFKLAFKQARESQTATQYIDILTPGMGLEMSGMPQ